MDECFQGEIVKYEIRNKYSEMGERDIFAAYFPVEGSAGINRIVCVLQDITARKEAEKHLIQMESRYRGLLEAAPDAMVVVNQGGEIVLFNVQAEKQFGYSRDELLGQSVKSIITRGSRSGWSRTLCDPRRTRWRSRSAWELNSRESARMEAIFPLRSC